MGGLNISALWRPFIVFFRASSKPEIDVMRDSDHAYIRGQESQRSPCPFLNALANHNYLPRDGQGITQVQLKAALLATAKCSPLLSNVLTSIVRPLLDPHDGTFSLVDLRQHNTIEHDRSFTRLDFRQGDNSTFRPAMFEAFLADAHHGPITADSLARSRARRDAEGKRVVGAKRLGPKLWVTTWSQTCILLEIFGAEMRREDVETFFREERLPQWWLDHPGCRPTMRGLVGNVLQVWWKHLFVKVPEQTLKNPLRGW